MSSPTFSLKTGIFFMLFAALLFSGMGALMKFCAGHLPVIEIAFARTAISLPFLLSWLGLRPGSLRVTRWDMLLLRSVAGFTALLLSVYANAALHLADAAILNLSAPVFVAVIAALFLRERLGVKGFFYIGLALLGAGLIVKPTGDISLFSGLAGLASGFFAAIAYIAIKVSLRTESVYSNVLFFTLFSTVGALPAAPSFIAPTPIEWLALGGIGLLGTVAQLCMTRSYRHGDASVIAPFAFSGVFFSSGWGFLFWHERPDTASVLGSLLVIICGIGLLRLKKQAA